MSMKPASGTSKWFGATTASFPLGRVLELLAVFIVLQSAFGMIALRAHCFYALPIWCLSLLITYGYALIRQCSEASEQKATLWHIVLIVGVGLLFRLPPFEWVLGGQDQGVYVNMAMELARTGALNPVDRILPHLTDASLRDLYVHANYSPDYLPGVYSRGDGLTFQFYHLFPVWLALFAGPGEVGVAVYGLTFLSIVSLLAFYRLAYLLSGSEKVALVSTLLLAVNPLHAFFSKFPVTEVPTLAFSLLSFGFLVSSLRRESNRLRRIDLGLSIATLGLVFLTRISGFMYIPFLYGVSIAAVVMLKDIGQQKLLLIWSAAGAWIYALSVLYGLEWSRPYSMDIYHFSFSPVLGSRWRYILLGIGAVAAGAWIAVYLAMRSSRMTSSLRRIAAITITALPFVGLILFALGLYKAHKLGFTDAYAMNAWEGRRFQLAGSGWRGFFSTSLVASATYLSPFLWVSIVPSLFLSREPYLKALSFFVVAFLAYVSILQWVLPYQPYYGRYLVSEFVPYVILLVACVWGRLAARSRLSGLFSVLLAFGLIWSIGLSVLQLGKKEHGGVVESIESLTEGMDSGDAIIIAYPICCNLQSRLATTLSFTQGMNVLRLDRNNSGFIPFLDQLDLKYDDIYLITDASVDALPGADRLRSTRLNAESFRHGILPPIEVHTRSTQLNVFKYSSSQELLFDAKGARGVRLMDGWSEIETWGVWSKGDIAHLRIEAGTISSLEESEREYVLEVRGRAFVSPQHPTQQVFVLVDGKLAAELAATMQQPHLNIMIDGALLGGKDAVDIEIRTPDAVSPANLGISGDMRVLGFGLESVVVKERAD